jgi:hypothetical protein
MPANHLDKVIRYSGSLFCGALSYSDRYSFSAPAIPIGHACGTLFFWIEVAKPSILDETVTV